MGEPERVLDLRRVLEAVDSGWRKQAACRDEPDDRLFLSDKSLAHNQPGSPSILLAMLVCADCPVRRDCRLEAMTPIASPLQRWDPAAETLKDGAGPHHVMLASVWGGTVEPERAALRDVSIPEAIERLERTFPARLAALAGVFERAWAARRARKGRPARAKALLAKPEVAELPAVTRHRCLNCSRRMPALACSDARYCSARCRVAAYRARAGAGCAWP